MRSIPFNEIVIILSAAIKNLIYIKHGTIDGIEKAVLKVFSSVIKFKQISVVHSQVIQLHLNETRLII